MIEQKELEQRVRERAYQIWLDEGRPEGRAKDHWQEAEKQIIGEEPGQISPMPGPYQDIS